MAIKQKVVRTIHGSPESVQSLNEYLEDGWVVVSSILLPAVSQGSIDFKNCIEYVIEYKEE